MPSFQRFENYLSSRPAVTFGNNIEPGLSLDCLTSGISNNRPPAELFAYDYLEPFHNCRPLDHHTNDTYNPYHIRTLRSRKMSEKTERFEMRVPGAFLLAVDDWRRRQPDIPSRAEAIRRLVEQALAAKPKSLVRGRGNG